MTTPHKATNQQWATVEEGANGEMGDRAWNAAACLLEIRDRLAALEAKVGDQPEPAEPLLPADAAFGGGAVMTDPHPITPPPELVREWCEQLFGCPDEPEINAFELARLAGQWSADQELEACCEYLLEQGQPYTAAELRATRRPKPPTLKRQAFKALDAIEGDFNTVGDRVDTIRRALEQLPDE